MPKLPNTMEPFLYGLDPSGRRMLVLLPRGDDEVGIILTTTVLSMSRNRNNLVFLVQEYRNGLMRLTGVFFDTAAREMFTGDGAPCFFAVDDSGRNHVDDMLRLFQLQFPGAWIATV